jgi:hypothetical protein
MKNAALMITVSQPDSAPVLILASPGEVLP